MSGFGSVPGGSSPRSMARYTMAEVADRRAAQYSSISRRISGDVAAPASRARVRAAPRGSDRTSPTDRARPRRSDATLPVSGTWMRVWAARARACVTSSSLVCQRRYSVVLCTPARAAMVSRLMS
jgi:hypothetical protein